MEAGVGIDHEIIIELRMQTFAEAQQRQEAIMDRCQMAQHVKDAISPSRHFPSQFVIVHRQEHLVGAAR